MKKKKQLNFIRPADVILAIAMLALSFVGGVVIGCVQALYGCVK